MHNRWFVVGWMQNLHLAGTAIWFNLSLAEAIAELVGWCARSVRKEEDIVSP